MKCSIVIPIWNQPDATKNCIEHIIKNTRYPYKLILVDNGSSAPTKDYLKDLAQRDDVEIQLVRNEKNLGFIKAVNQGLRFSKDPYICILNNDTMPGKSWLTQLVEFAEKHPDVGLLNPIPSGHLTRKISVNEYAKKLFPNKGMYMEMNQCQGFCMLIKREVIKKIGYLDERFGMGGFDDTDYSMRAHIAGYKCVSVYSSYVYHSEHKSFDCMGERKKIQALSEKEYFKKWPRHKRVAVAFSIFEGISREVIENFLKHCLFLAQEWCWVNLFIFGDKNVQARVEAVKKKINLPVHQNMKFNYLSQRFKWLELAVRILERSFGSKRRKKYDKVILNDEKLASLVQTIRQSHTYQTRSFEDMKCDIILPVCNQYDFTKKCIESIRENTDTPYRLIVINNGNNPDTKKLLDCLEKDDSVETTIVHQNKNIGWVKALNRGIELSNAPYVCFQNDDTVVTRGWLRKMINILRKREEFGVINPSWQGRPPRVSIDAYNARLENNMGEFIETDWCRGFSVVVKRSVMERIGCVDEIYGLAYFDDVDYSVTAIEAGFKALKALDTYVYHHMNVTFFEILKGKKWNELHEKNKLIYYKKWGKPLKIVVIFNKRICKDENIQEMEKTIFYLAGKQHHIDIWSPEKLKNRFKHTNIRVRACHPLLLKFLSSLDIEINKRKKPEKRYKAVFKCDARDNLPQIMKQEVDRLKEKTKDLIDVKL